MLQYLKKAFDEELSLGEDHDDVLLVSRIRSIVERAIQMSENDSQKNVSSIRFLNLRGEEATTLRKELNRALDIYGIDRDAYPAIYKLFDHLVNTRPIYEKETYTITVDEQALAGSQGCDDGAKH